MILIEKFTTFVLTRAKYLVCTLSNLDIAAKVIQDVPNIRKLFTIGNDDSGKKEAQKITVNGKEVEPIEKYF